jgi:hypothetical protein
MPQRSAESVGGGIREGDGYELQEDLDDGALERRKAVPLLQLGLEVLPRLRVGRVRVCVCVCRVCVCVRACVCACAWYCNIIMFKSTLTILWW